MKTRTGWIMALAILGVAIGVRATPKADWNPLFNGRDLSGWKSTEPKLWLAENGMIIGRSPGIKANNFLFTEKRYENFELNYEVRLVKDEGNSGVQIRSEQMPGGHAKGYQVDVGKCYWGSLYHEEGRGMLAPFKRTEGAKDDPIKLDQFNKFEVVADNHHITVHVNGVKTVDLDDPAGELDGFIGLQVHSGDAFEVQFKNIMIRELP